MNQHRWTCLTTLILGASIAPISTVEAKVPSPAIASENNYLPLSPQSLPTITPLTVTVETDAIPTAIQPVPQVSKLPIVALSSDRTNQHKKIARVGILTKNLPPQSPTATTTPIFNPNFQATEPIVSIPNSTLVNTVVPIPQITARSPKLQAFRSFINQTASAPISVVRSDNSQTTIINNSIALEAEIDRQSHTKDSRRSAAIDPKNRSIAIATPQHAIIPDPNHQSDLPSFEAGFPIFIFDNQPPQQILTTAIAQMGDEIIAPESSIAIPVARPKQSTIPTVPASSSPQPGTGIVKIEQPSATVQPALTKIVATQTGTASWYGTEAGSQTANGERYNPRGLTAAHRTLPFGTKVRLTSIKTGKTVIVRINDRGPFHRRRIIDVSAGAAEAIGIKNAGISEIRMEILVLER